MSKIKYTTLLEYDADTLRVWQYLHDGRVPLLSFFDLLSVGESNFSWPKSVNTKQFKSKKHRMIAIIPRHEVIVRYLKLPSVNDKEIEKIVSLQVIQHIPYSLDQIIMNYIVAERQDDGYSKVVVFCVTKKYVDEYLTRLSQINISPDFLTIDVLGFPSWFTFHYPKKIGNKNIVLVVYSEGERVDLIFLKNKHILYTRHLRLGRQNSNEHVLEQIKMTVLNFQNENVDEKLTQMIGIGRGDSFLNLISSLSSVYNIESQVIDPLEGIKTRSDFQWSSIVQERCVWPTMGNGLTIQDHNILNFIPQEINQKKIKTKSIKNSIRILVVFLIALFLLFSGFYASQYKKTKIIKNLKQELESVNQKVMALEAVQERVDNTKKFFKERLYFAEMMHALMSDFPSTTTLTLIDISDNNMIIIQGFTSGEQDIQSIQERMNRSRLFKNVSLDFINKRQTKEGSVIYFKLIAEWQGRS